MTSQPGGAPAPETQPATDTQPDPATQPAGPADCPYLGVLDDARTHFSFTTVDHRCFSASKSREIDVAHQAAMCLGASYATCGRYVPMPMPGSSARRPGSGRARLLAFALMGLLVVIVVVGMVYVVPQT